MTPTASNPKPNCTHNVNRVHMKQHIGATLNDFYPRESNRIVVFDWDDTLYPTTSLIKKHNKINATELRKLSELVFDLLNVYLSVYGRPNVYIITNGEQNWVLQSLQIAIDYCDKYDIQNHKFQCIFDLILWGKITTISANYLYSSQYPKQTMIWKYFVFQQIITSRFAVNSGRQCVVVCIGDSWDEFYASKTVTLSSSNCENTALHRLKLIAKPSISEMNQEFELIISLAPIFEENQKNITIDYAKEKAKFLHSRKNM